MSESKYGRLFTEADVERLLAEATRDDPGWMGAGESEPDGATVLLECEDRLGELTFPADEPLFLLRGQDLFAQDAVAHYAQTYRLARMGSGEWSGHYHAVLECAGQIGEWQMVNPDRVKVPD